MPEPKKRKLGFLLLAGILTAAAALFFFGWLAEEVLEADTAQFDTAIRTAIHQLASPGLTSAMEVFSFVGSTAFLAGLTVVVMAIFIHLHRPRAATLIAITMAGAAVLNVDLKYAFHRTRPIAFFGTSPTSYSFPSGHALGSLCFYGVLAVIISTQTQTRTARVGIWLLAVLLIVMIGLSRIYLGVHYPSDVLAGYCAGVVWVGVVGYSDRYLRSQAR